MALEWAQQTASCIIYLGGGGTVAAESSMVARGGAHLNVGGRAHGRQLLLGDQPPVQGDVPPLAGARLRHSAADDAHCNEAQHFSLNSYRTKPVTIWRHRQITK